MTPLLVVALVLTVALQAGILLAVLSLHHAVYQQVRSHRNLDHCVGNIEACLGYLHDDLTRIEGILEARLHRDTHTSDVLSG